MKRVPAKSADNGRAVTARMAESCANDIDRFPPRKSSAERRMRPTCQPNSLTGRAWLTDACLSGVKACCEWHGPSTQTRAGGPLQSHTRHIVRSVRGGSVSPADLQDRGQAALTNPSSSESEFLLFSLSWCRLNLLFLCGS